MKLRAAPGSSAAAGISLAARSGLLRHRGAVAVLRRGGLATAVGLAALRSPERAVLIRDHDSLTGRQLDAAVRATALAMTQRWAPGARIGLRGDGGIDFVMVLAAAGMAGIDVLPIGARHGALDAAALGRGVDEVVDAWEVAVRSAAGFETGRRRRGPSARGGLLIPSTGTGGVPSVTARGRVGLRGLLQLADADRRLRLPAGVLLVLAPPDHGHGLTMVAAGLARGRSVVLASGMRPAEQAEAAARHGVATVSGVPAQLGRLLDADPSALDGVRLVVSGSSKLPGALRARLAAGGARVLDCYGSTETGTVAIEGRPLAGVTIGLDAGGRILISSPLGGRARDPGDLGHLEDGRLVIDGRRGDLIDSGGELVAPERVAAALRALPGVADATVTVEADDLLGSVLCAAVTVTPASGLDDLALREALAGSLPRAGIPRRWAVGTGG